LLGSLNISSVTANLAGTYHCSAENAAGESVTIEVTLIVLYPPTIVTFREAAVYVVGNSQSLPCAANAFPYASYEWTVPDGTIVTHDR